MLTDILADVSWAIFGMGIRLLWEPPDTLIQWLRIGALSFMVGLLVGQGAEMKHLDQATTNVLVASGAIFSEKILVWSQEFIKKKLF